MKTSHRLVEGVLAGDPAAFDAFYERYFDRIYLYAHRRSASREDAERLCRAIFGSVVARLGRHGAEQDLDVWVLAIARRVVARAGSRTHGASAFEGEQALGAEH
jgi:DNA-directed RNA polymerase specialized sigma24 family protein